MSSGSDYSAELLDMAMRLTQATTNNTTVQSSDSSTDPFETVLSNPAWSNLVLSSQCGSAMTQDQLTLTMNILGGIPCPLSSVLSDHNNTSGTPSMPDQEMSGAESSPYASPGQDNINMLLPDSTVSHTSNGEEGPVEGIDIDQYNLVLCNPFVWGAVVLELHTLGPKDWLAGSIITFYLSHHWFRVCETSAMYYMDIEYVAHPNLPEQQQIANYRSRHPLTLGNHSFYPRPVVFIVHHSDHYFVVVFDYQNLRSFVFGSFISKSGIFMGSEHWDDWKGSLLWISIACYHGWAPPDFDDVEVVALQWHQNGIDCGVTVTSVVMMLLRDGLCFDDDGHILKPKFPCAHSMRQKILSHISGNVFQLYKSWKRIISRAGDQWGGIRMQNAENVLNGEGSIHVSASLISASLTKAMAKCRSCVMAQREAAERQQPSSNPSDHPDESVHDNQQHDSGISAPEDTAPLPDHLKAHKLMKGARNRNTLRPRCPPSNSKTIIIPPQRFIPLPSNRDFDEYYRGPTVEDYYDGPRYLYNFPTNPYAMITEPGAWETFKDYGYRLEPSFALMFNNEQPIKVREHLLPVGERSGMGEQLEHLKNITGDYSLTRNGKEAETIKVEDVISMGMEEMLDYADTANTMESMKVFVCGRDLDNGYIHFDPTRDEVEVDEDDIVTTVDIDSMIWVTHKPVFKNAFQVFVLPRIAKTAPIWRHNHVYVDILMPRSDDDKDNGGRSEWLSKSFPLTAIPHTHFASIGSGAGSVDVSVFFPRMIHRDSMTGWRVNNIPMVVQSTWFSEILLPSIIAASTAGCIEYVDFTLEEWRWKASINERFQKNKSVPVLGSNMEGLLYSMRTIIDNNEELDMFGSFFFVCEFRGAKGITTGEDPYDSLCREYPGIDWAYALQRKNGQLFLDVGISFHAITTDNAKLVGLWRLDAVNASYEAAGMKKGVTHHSNTMAGIGGRQSEAEVVRMRAVQLNFRSTYNLVFESIRKPGIKSYFCDDDEAYDCSPDFLESCDRYMKIFKGAKGKSYGVREELRGSGPAMLTVLENALDKARTYIQSKPILWVRSEIWFEFSSRRLLELKNLQVRMSKSPQPNYGIMTSIVMHLIRYIGITPINKLSYVNAALIDLNFGPTIERFGMFFLQDLHFNPHPILDEIESSDDEVVARVMKLDLKRRRRLRRAPPIVNTEPTALYPFGESPSWTTIIDALQSNPHSIIKPWIWDEVLEVNEHASGIFVQMTIDLWLSLADIMLSGDRPHPTNLKEAMECWSAHAINEALVHCHFTASNHSLKGPKTGKKHASFRDMFKIFFRPSDTLFHDHSVWKPFVKKGYLKSYHDICGWLSAQGVQEMDNALKSIFARLQCLPPASHCANGQRQTGRTWKSLQGAVEMLTNPRYYRLLRIGGRIGMKKRAATRLKISQVVLDAKLDEEHCGIPFKVGRRKTCQDKRSSRRKNFRQPPKHTQVSTDSDEEEDQLMDDDANEGDDENATNSSDDEEDDDGSDSDLSVEL